MKNKVTNKTSTINPIKMGKMLLILAVMALSTMTWSVQAADLCKRQKDTGLIMPKKGPTGAYEVGVGIVPHSLTKFDTKDGTADIDFYFTVEYELEGEHADIKCVGDDAADVWKIFYNPDVEFMTIPDPEAAQGFHWLIEKNRFVFMTRLKGSVVLAGDFRWFPFDRVVAPIRMQGEDDDRILRLKPSKWYLPNYPDLTKEMSTLRLPGWVLTRAEYLHVRDPWNDGRFGDQLDFEIEITRTPLPFLVRAGLPLTLILIVALVTRKTLHRSADVQMQVLSGLLLSIFAYSIYLNDRIPETDYLTFGDYMWIGALISIFSIIIGRLAAMQPDVHPWRVRIELISTAIAMAIYVGMLLTAVVLSLKHA